MARLLMCVLALGLTVAFLSCKSDGLRNGGIHEDGGPALSSSTTHGDGSRQPVGGSGGRSNSSTYIHRDGSMIGSGGNTRMHYDGSSAGGTRMHGDGTTGFGGSGGTSTRTSTSIHGDGSTLPIGGSGGTSTRTSTSIHGDGWITPVGGSGGITPRTTFQGDAAYPVGGRSGTFDAGTPDASVSDARADGGDGSVF